MGVFFYFFFYFIFEFFFMVDILGELIFFFGSQGYLLLLEKYV